MIDDLMNFIYSDRFNDPWVYLYSAKWEDNSIGLVFKVFESGQPENAILWNVNCKDIIDYDISAAYGGGIAHYDSEHPLVKQHSDDRVYLHLSSKSNNKEYEIEGQLLEKHNEICDGHIDFNCYLNKNIEVSKLLRSGSGELANGPYFLLNEYKKILDNYGIESNLSGKQPNKRYHDAEWIEISSSISAIHFGNSYVVAEVFEVQKQD